MSLDDRINNAPNPTIKARRMRARGDSVDSIAAALRVDTDTVVEWLTPRPMSRPKRGLVAGIVSTFKDFFK